MTPQPSGSPTWRWVALGAIGLATIGGGSWASYLQGQVAEVKMAGASTADKVQQQQVDQAVTKQKVQDIDRKVDEVKKDVGDIKTILQQIQINQQQQIRDQQPRR